MPSTGSAVMWALAIAMIFLLSMVIVLACAYALPLVMRWKQYCRWRRSFKGYVALTYDDGPDAFTAPLLLDVLKRYGVRATFFIVGFRAERHPELVDRMVAEGHEVACHGYQHVNAWRQLPWSGVREIEHAYRAMRRWIPSNGAYRPPSGKLTVWQWLALRRRQSRIAWWTDVVGDTRDPLPDLEAACDRIIKQGGGVLLLHCDPKKNRRRDFTVRFTELLLERLSEHALEPVPLLSFLKSESRPPHKSRQRGAGEYALQKQLTGRRTKVSGN